MIDQGLSERRNSRENGVEVYPNKGRKVDRAFQIGLIATYPLVVWFGLFIIEFPISIPFLTFIWILLIAVWEFYPFVPREISFEKDGLEVRYRKGPKWVDYESISVVLWGKDFGGAGVTLIRRNEEGIKMVGIDKELMQEILDRIGKARPDLTFGTYHKGILSTEWGTIADAEHKEKAEEYWKMRFIDSFKYEYFFWGLRPKKKETGVIPHVLDLSSRKEREKHGK